MGSLVADRLRGIEASTTLALAAKAKALRQAGKPVLDFTAGEPDFPTPQSIKDAGIRAIESDKTKYTPAAGILELRRAIANDVCRRLGPPGYDPTEVMVSCGAKHVLYNALQAICEPGDEVIVLAPYWVSYVPLVQLADAQPQIVQMREADQFQPDPSEIEQRINDRTKAIILNSPSNPTGAVIGEQRLKAIAEVIKRKSQGDRLVVISDEIYDQIVFEPTKPCSIFTVAPELREQMIIVNGVSKAYSMTGWRIGYGAGPKNIIDAMTTLQSHATSNPTSISQYAALAAITGDQRPVAEMRSEFQRRRDRLVNGLNRLPGLSCVMPQGAFYAWCNIGKLGQPAEAIAARWLEDALVAVVPGEGFGSKDHVRFSFATAMPVIDEGLASLKGWLATHS